MDEERAIKKQDGGNDSKLGQAMKIFEEALRGGPKLHRDVHPLLDAANISVETKRRARWKVGDAKQQERAVVLVAAGTRGPAMPQAVIEQKIEDVDVM
jgi:hypothetical protein